MSTKNIKLRVWNEEMSRKAQEKAFELGLYWPAKVKIDIETLPEPLKSKIIEVQNELKG